MGDSGKDKLIFGDVTCFISHLFFSGENDRYAHVAVDQAHTKQLFASLTPL